MVLKRSPVFCAGQLSFGFCFVVACIFMNHNVCECGMLLGCVRAYTALLPSLLFVEIVVRTRRRRKLL